MTDIYIHKAQKEEFHPIARLITGQNKNPKTHCIHSDNDANEPGVYEEMLSLDRINELCFVVAWQGEQLIGALGSEFDEEAGRGWLRGPFVLAEGDQWDYLASALLQELLANLPPAIRRLDSFLNIANEQGNRFYLDQGFQRIRLVYVYTISAAEAPLPAATSCLPLPPAQAEAFAALHDAVFPVTYINGQRLIAQIDHNHQAFVYLQGEELLGYLYAFIAEGAPEGIVEFVGVKPEARGRGIGRQLLLAALHWFIEDKKLPQVSLTVNDDLDNARSLYEKVGFKLKYTGVHTRKDL